MAIDELFLYSPSQAASILGISRSRVYTLMAEGQLQSIHVGRSRKFTRTHLSEFIDRMEEAS